MYDIQKAISEFKNNKNNAVAHVYEDASFSEGLLDGITISIKDVFATKDAATQASSKILEGFQTLYDATVVDKLKKSGAAIIGKTHLDELALGGTGTYSAYGIITNPLDPTRFVGGSSSGAAATLTKNIGIAIGSDTGDSVRLPASFVGKVGFKPTYGAVSRFGLFSYASSLDTVAWLTHDVQTAINAAQVLYGKDEKDMTSKDIEIQDISIAAPKKVAFLSCHEKLSDYVEKKYTETIEKFKNAGVEVEIVSIDEKLLDAITPVYKIISYSEASSNDANLTGVQFGKRIEGKDWSELMTNTRTKGFGKMVQRRFTLGAYYLEDENQLDYFVRAQKIRRLISEAFAKILNNFDLLIFPSTEGIANKLLEPRVDNYLPGLLTSSNLLGNPSVSLPWGTFEDMPFGIQLGAANTKDKKLLSHALWVEKLIGGVYE